jgi:basic membrane protein A
LLDLEEGSAKVNGKLVRPLVAVVLALSLGVAACGGDDNEGGGASSGGGSADTQQKLRIGMVTDIGGLNDRSFNESAYKGLQRAQKELGAEIRVVTSKSNADYVPNLSSLARQKYDLVVAVGFLMAEATETVAKSFPQQKFAIIDSSAAAMKSKPQNVEGLLFAEQEAGYLVGYMAGLYVKDKGGKQVVSSVGGQKIPPVDHYIAGFQAAGQCGLGALDAAKQESVQGIGVDADQAYLGPQVMTSALKKIDEAVFKTITEVQNDAFKGGQDTVFDVKTDGVGYGKTNDVGAKYTDQVDAQKAKIASGKLANIPSEVQ